MWDNFYDDVKLEKCVGIDKMNNLQYDTPVSVNVRYVKGYEVYEQGKETTGTKFNRVYHVPTNLEIKEKDRLNGLTVKECKAIRGISGEIHFVKVVVS